MTRPRKRRSQAPRPSPPPGPRADGPAPGRGAPSAPVPAPPPTPDAQSQSMEEKLGRIYDRVVTRTNAETQGLFEIMGSRRRLLWINFLSGLSRGVGFFLGATLVGGLVLALGALFIDTTAETLGLGDWDTNRLVRAVYSKIVEIRSIVTDLDASTSATDAQDAAALPPAATGPQQPPADPVPAEELDPTDPEADPPPGG